MATRRVDGARTAPQGLDHAALRGRRRQRHGNQPLGRQPHFAQILLLSRTTEPLGQRRYWPIYEAAASHNLPVAIHAFGYGGNPVTSGGWPSFYIEEMCGHAQCCQALLASMVLEGVFEHFPTLKVILVEAGFAWLPPLAWRLDTHWHKLKGEIPHLKRPPSEVIREHVWLTTQPMEEPDTRRHLKDTWEWIGADRLIFATDYPHWDYDDPAEALPIRLERCGPQKLLPRQRARPFTGSSISCPATSLPPRMRLAPANARSSPSRTARSSSSISAATTSGILNRCPHQGGKLCDGVVTGHITSSEPGRISYERPGEIIRCPWHGWFFDLRTGQSWGEPERIKTRNYDVAVA